MRYTQLTHEERYQIAALLKAEHDQTEIAMILGRHKSTICREIRRSTGLRGCRPRQAQRLTEHRRFAKARHHISELAWSHVDTLLKEDWSPEQISLWIKAEQAISISHQWIYQYILQDKAYGADLYRNLRCQKKRRKRYGSYNRRGQCVTALVLTNDLLSLSLVHALVIGNSIPSSEKITNKPSSR